MGTTIFSGIVMIIFGAAIAVIAALRRILRGSNTPDDLWQYMAANISASFCMLAGIAAFVLDIALRLNK